MNAFYRAYLDEEICRIGTNCEKWDHLEALFGRNELLPLWVADMDFRTVPCIKDALVKRAEHAIYGYTANGQEERAAEVGWLKRRHNLEVEEGWILYSPGVVDSIFFCVDTLTAPGDAILIQPPVYGPFFTAVNLFDRKLVKNDLKRTTNGWEMDFEDLEQKFASEQVRMMILCNPHNPVGRVWTRAELSRVLELANRYNVILIADEIHADFVFDGRKIDRILSLEGSDRCVMLASATKSFNLAGLRQSSIIIKDDALRAEIARKIERAHQTTPNVFGAIAQMTAYQQGDEWMDAVVEYIQENRDYTVAYLNENLPEIGCYPQEGTYLMWLDFHALGLSHDAAFELLVQKAGVALNSGKDFGESGELFFRMNLATPRANIERALEAINKAIRSR